MRRAAERTGDDAAHFARSASSGARLGGWAPPLGGRARAAASLAARGELGGSEGASQLASEGAAFCGLCPRSPREGWRAMHGGGGGDCAPEARAAVGHGRGTATPRGGG